MKTTDRISNIKTVALALMIAGALLVAAPFASRTSAPDPATRALANVDTFWIVTLDAATGTGTEIQVGGGTQVALEYEISTGTTAGVVVLEHSAVSGYAGTWANLDTETVGSSFATAPSKTFFTYPGPMGYIRPRVTTTFSGGADPRVTVRLKRMFGQ